MRWAMLQQPRALLPSLVNCVWPSLIAFTHALEPVAEREHRLVAPSLHHGDWCGWVATCLRVIGRRVKEARVIRVRDGCIFVT